MTGSLRIFLTGLIDYAGLFPPAGLGMRDAVGKFAAHLGSEYSWMLGCFICPVGRLDEFELECDRLLEIVGRSGPIQVSAIGSAVREPDGAVRLAAADGQTISRFEDAGWARVTQLEVKWPFPHDRDRPAGASGRMAAALRGYRDALMASRCSVERVFVEIPRVSTWADDAVAVAGALAEAGPGFGFKIRTGGLTADLYPSIAEVAAAVTACRDAGVPFKATAGLHHPVRHLRADGAVTEHGFMNVFAGAILADALKLDEADVSDILNEKELRSFDFSEEHLRWRSYEVSAAALERSRGRFATSFGSCSFEEPLDDLSAASLVAPRDQSD